jgi:hypothetical protein
MKWMLLLIIFTSLATTASAQAYDPELKKKFDAFLQKNRVSKITIKDFKGSAGIPPIADTSIFIPWQGNSKPVLPKPGVYALPQDGMPCVVPYTADIAAIPNAMPQKKVEPFGKIPNATPQTGEELRRNQRQFFELPSR